MKHLIKFALFLLAGVAAYFTWDILRYVIPAWAAVIPASIWFLFLTGIVWRSPSLRPGRRDVKWQYLPIPIPIPIPISAWRKPRILSHHERRKLRKQQNGGSHTRSEWESIKATYGYRCVRCGEQKPLTKDHIVPLVKGGTDNITNIQPLCQSCNSAKGTNAIDYRSRSLAQ